MSRNGGSTKATSPGQRCHAKPPAEYTRPLKGLAVKPLGFADPYAPGAGFWAAGQSLTVQGGLGDLAHCYGSVGVGRDLSPDTGTGGELYAVIGQGPRHSIETLHSSDG